MKISLSSVNVTERTRELVNKVLDEGAIGQSGYIEQFEDMVANYVGSKFCIAVSSGTMADAVAVAAIHEMHYCPRGIVPALTFIAQPNSVRYNSLGVSFVDVDDRGLININSIQNKIKYQDNPPFIFATDLLGNIAPVEDLKNMGYPVIEDACEAFGSTMDGKYAGTFGDLGTFSFYPSHTITTGEGGAIVTDDPRLAQLCRSIRNHGRENEHRDSNRPENKFNFSRFGFNAKMTGMQAAIGISMMENIEEYVTKRKHNYQMMNMILGCGFEHREGISIVPHGYPIIFNDESARDRAIHTLTTAGIECRKLFSSIPSKELYYANRDAGFPYYHRSVKHAALTLYLPCHQNMNNDDIEYINAVMKDIPYDKEATL